MENSGKLWKYIIVLVFLAATVACSTTVGFNIYDKETSEPLDNYTIQIDGKVLKPGDTIDLSTAVWKDYRARIQADGYRTEDKVLVKDVYVGRAIVGYFLFWPELLWCYGPKEDQAFYLYKTKG
jgi:hypothetical protein